MAAMASGREDTNDQVLLGLRCGLQSFFLWASFIFLCLWRFGLQASFVGFAKSAFDFMV